MKKFLIWVLCILGVGVLGCAIGGHFYAKHKGHDNVIDWLKTTKMFKSESVEEEIADDVVSDIVDPETSEA